MSVSLIIQALIAGILVCVTAEARADQSNSAVDPTQEAGKVASFSARWHPDLERLAKRHHLSSRTRNFGPTIAASKAILDKIGKESGEHSTDFASALHMHAMQLNAADRPAEAKPLLTRALILSAEVFDDKHSQTLKSIHGFAFVSMRLGDLQRAA